MSKDIIIVPDVHENLNTLTKILNDYHNYQIIFLGDYFDDFGPRHSKEIARIIKEELYNTKRIFLFGNHDLQYAFPFNNMLKCSGYMFNTEYEINSILGKREWDMFKFFHWLREDWLCTHAGLHPYYNDSYILDDNLHLIWIEQLRTSHNTLIPILQAGHARDGFVPFGGITWCDWRYEFRPIGGLNQILGHTRGDDVRYNKTLPNSKNICLDTALNHIMIFHNDNTFDIVML
jgi:hypothetical protein